MIQQRKSWNAPARLIEVSQQMRDIEYDSSCQETKLFRAATFSDGYRHQGFVARVAAAS
jgi:hypothetical protein